MKKKVEKYIKNANVELPENLKRENIESLLRENNEGAQVVEFKPKKHIARKTIAIAASLAIVLGIASYAGRSVKNRIAVSKATKTLVVSCDDYEEIYTQLEAIKAKNTHNTSVIEEARDFFNNRKYESVADLAVNESGDLTFEKNASASDAAPSSSGSYGQTNTQEEDVDEGNVIKTDGRYLYLLHNGTVYIVQSQDGKIKKLAEVTAENKEYEALSPVEIYVQNGKLILIGRAIEKSAYTNIDYAKDRVYTPSLYMPYYSSDTFTAIYDISDINNICLLKQYCQSGNYVSSRITKDRIYCITQEYVDIYDENYKDDCIPEIENEDGKKTVEAKDISIIPGTDSPVYTVITTCGTDGKGKVFSNAILGRTDTVYATSEKMFLVAGDYDEKNDISITNIYKFGYTNNGTKFEAEGSVPGYINNQFSLDYEKGYLRIATTYDKIISDGRVKEFDGELNALYILDKNLNIAGKLDKLAEDEIIKSARYIGDYAYVVTFRQTDPLFVIDLSDPKKPAVVGELSIPGFSSYLHPITDTLMVGAGSDGDEENVNDDCKVSLFDISDKTNPMEISKLTVASQKGNYVYTDIGYNHKLFVSLPGNEFAIPFSEDNYDENNDQQYVMKSMYIRYGIVDNQLREIARYTLQDNFNDEGGTYIGDTFFVLSNGYSENGGYFAAVSSYSLSTNEALDTFVISENE